MNSKLALSLPKSFFQSLIATVQTILNVQIMDQIERSREDVKYGRVRTARELYSDDKVQGETVNIMPKNEFEEILVKFFNADNNPDWKLYETFLSPDVEWISYCPPMKEDNGWISRICEDDGQSLS